MDRSDFDRYKHWVLNQNMDAGDSIAILALVVSSVALTWTIVVDKRKPRLKVRADIRIVIEQVSSEKREITGNYFMISITNFGPGKALVQGAGMRRRSWFARRWRRFRDTDNQAFLQDPSPESPHRLPRWMEVGDTITLFYPADSEIVTQTELDDIVVWDSFSNHHSAQKYALRDARNSENK